MYNIIKINTCGTSTVPHNWCEIAHSGINRLYYIHGGNGGYIINGKKYPFAKNMLYFFPYTVDSHFYLDQNNRIVHTYMDFELSPPIISETVTEFNPHTSVITENALNIFVEAGKEYKKNGFSNHMESNLTSLCSSAVSYLVSVMVKDNPHIRSSKDDVINFIIEYMIKNINNNFSVNNVAGQVFLAPDTLIRRFKKSMGITPYAYFKNLRIRTAKSMIANGQCLSDVASAVGYSDTTSLLHALKG